MDMKVLREEVVEATTRFFLEKRYFLPSADSEEWEDEYRRQLALAKRRHAAKPAAGTAPPGGAVLTDESEGQWPELSGAPAEARWAMKLRAERMAQIANKELRDWLGGAWASSKAWIDTRELPMPAFLRRIEGQYAEHRRQSAIRASTAQAERQTTAAAVETVQRRVQAAGITVAGLIELIDVSDRRAVAPLRLKLAELDAGRRSLRVFETGNAAILMVIENGEAGRTEYAIERDEGLVADLKLFAQNHGA
jgi:hypothetical protein